MAVDDIYQMTVTAQSPAGFFQNTFAVSSLITTDPTSANFATLAADWVAIWRPQQSDTITWRSWRARQVRGGTVVWPTGTSCNPTGGFLLEGNITSNNNGADLGEALPPQCAMVITFKTGVIGRRARGRNYIFGFTEADQNGGTWAAATLSALETNIATFMTKYVPGTAGNFFRLGVWSYRTASGCEPNPTTHVHTRIDPPAPSLAFTPVTTHVLRSVVHTQRRRVAGVGR